MQLQFATFRLLRQVRDLSALECGSSALTEGLRKRVGQTEPFDVSTDASQDMLQGDGYQKLLTTALRVVNNGTCWFKIESESWRYSGSVGILLVGRRRT